MAGNENGTSSKTSRHRSPLYPSCDLGSAVEMLREFFEANGPNPVHVDPAIEALGYSPSGSTGKRALAALIHYGLLEETGTGRDRTVRVSDPGMDIVLQEAESPRYEKAIENAALEPTVYMKLWDRYGAHIPSRGAVARFLLDEGFNHNVIDGVIKDYVATIGFAGLESEDPRTYLDGDKTSRDGEVLSDVGPRQERDTGRRESRVREPGGSNMPSTNAGEKDVWDLIIRYPDGTGQAVLRMPVPVSKRVYDYLRQVLNTNLDLQEPALTMGDEADDGAK